MGLKKSFGDKIYDLRMGLELTQEEFIARLSPPFSRTTLSYIENGSASRLDAFSVYPIRT
mgnify:CR=1 FL=1